MKKFIPKVAIIGRTNVGKSTLFNQIVGRKLAIVEDAPGVTRDRAYAMVNSQGFTFNLIDTGGLLGDTKDEFQDEITKQAQIAISQADIILVLFSFRSKSNSSFKKFLMIGIIDYKYSLSV